MSYFDENKKKTDVKFLHRPDGSAKDGGIVSFYNDCLIDYHEAAKKEGKLKKGLIFIPELMSYGEKTTMAFLNDPFFQAEFGEQPHMFYYVIMSLLIQAGMVYAVKWHENFSGLSDYVDRIIDEGPADESRTLIKQMGINNPEQENAFYQAIFKRWLAKHEPYWELSDPREYTFSAMLAAYQLGISMALEMNGY